MHIRKFEKSGEHFSHTTYESVSDAMHYYNQLKTKEIRMSQSSNQSKIDEYTGGSRHEMDWTGFTSEEQFQQVMRDGDLPKAKEIWAMPSPNIMVESIRRKSRMGECGDSLDVQRYLMSEFDKCWRSTYKRKAKGGTRNITLLADIAGNCGITSAELGWRGLSTLKIADVLCEAGYSVRVLCYDYAVGDCVGIQHNSLVTTVIKDFDEGMDVTKLASIICSAGYFRTVGFCSIVSMADNQGVQASGGLGSSKHLDGGDWKARFMRETCFEGEGDLYPIPIVKNQDQANKAMSDVLKHFGIEEDS